MSNKITIISVAHDGYRRAGLAFNKGENELDADKVSATQLAAIEKDPRLAVKGTVVETTATQGAVDTAGVGAGVKVVDGFIAGVADADGKVTALKDMKADELKALAKDLGIEGYANMTKPKLAEAIAAVPVQAPADGDTAADAGATA
ncbi:Rho termination factor N-terminal domain-containing protein [Shewanella avicenniae]|uniref:Rho termination factor N-terminal domain-containing protein n=1 Tax=Shewanella avicenniae TaxID=2814294 RepID=A0ABX7QMK7_9GAMM|nr:HI1506-related protein [Shewanella avicenniae]QSX32619.1 Rho termination factor N-terminal domain-containing protein [Shewanella avicenniae]